jgi:hypothetical protein
MFLRGTVQATWQLLQDLVPLLGLLRPAGELAVVCMVC